MKNTSVTLSEHFSKFIDEQINSGRYQSTSEVIRAGLRLLEEDYQKLENLRQALAVAEEQIKRGEFADYPLEQAIADMKNGL